MIVKFIIGMGVALTLWIGWQVFVYKNKDRIFHWIDTCEAEWELHLLKRKRQMKILAQKKEKAEEVIAVEEVDPSDCPPQWDVKYNREDNPTAYKTKLISTKNGS
jgi:hypothetical protein